MSKRRRAKYGSGNLNNVIAAENAKKNREQTKARKTARKNIYTQTSQGKSIATKSAASNSLSKVNISPEKKQRIKLVFVKYLKYINDNIAPKDRKKAKILLEYAYRSAIRGEDINKVFRRYGVLAKKITQKKNDENITAGGSRKIRGSGKRGDKRRSKKRKKKLTRKRKATRKEQRRLIEERRSNELRMGYEGNDQIDFEAERRLDLQEKMQRIQKKNLQQRYAEHIARPGQIDKRGHGGNTHKNKIYQKGGVRRRKRTRKKKSRC